MSKPTKKNMRRGSWVAIGLVAVAAAAHLMLFFLPNMRALSAKKVDLEAKQTFVLEAQLAYQRSQLTQAELQVTRDYNAKFGAQLVPLSELPALYREVSQIAKSHDVVTPKFEPLPGIEYETFQKRTIGLGVAGSFAGIHRLVRDLEALPARIWVSDMKFRAPREAGKPVECDLMLVVFVDNPEKSD